MHLSSSRLTLAATDLGRFLACRHLTGLDVDVAFGRRAMPPKYPDPFLDLPAGSLIEAKRFVLSLGRFGKALGPKELVGEMAEEAEDLARMYPRRTRAKA